MKILLITDNDAAIGGAETYFFELQTKLATQPNLCIFSIGFGRNAVRTPKYVVLKSPTNSFSKLLYRIYAHPKILRELKNLIHMWQPDIIHLHNIKHHTAALLKAIRGYRVIQSVHDFGLVCPTSQNIHRDGHVCPTGITRTCFWQHQVKFSKLVYSFVAYSFFQTRRRLRNLVTVFLVPSAILRDYLLKLGFDNVEQVPLFHKLPSRLPQAIQNPKHFLFAGQLSKHKGIYILLREFAIATKEDQGLHLHIAGHGQDEKRIKRLCQRYQLQDKITWYSWQTDLTPLFEKCTAVIFPSLGMESFGLVITEAMSHGRCVIAADRSTAPWLIRNGETGLLFDLMQPGDLAKKILHLSHHPDLAVQYGKQAYQHMQSFINNEQALTSVLTIYHRVMQHAPSSLGGAV